MTDLQKFIELYNGFGIELKVHEYENKLCIGLNTPSSDGNFHKKLSGYSGCFSDVEFTMEGVFINQGFYEG